MTYYINHNKRANLFVGQEGTSVLQSALINTNLTSRSIQSLSPEFAYSTELASANHLNAASNGMGMVAVPAPVRAPEQLNLNGTHRLNQFGHMGPPTAIQSFYHYFYNAHPFVLPHGNLISLLKERRTPLLEQAVQFIGASFLPELPTDMYKDAMNRAINSGSYPRDGYSVQALILFSIGLHAHNEVPRAAQIFGLAQNLTLELGLNRIDFAILNGNNDRQLEESWRRTWWSMYTVNGMMSAVNPGVQFRLKDIPTDVPLPCENDAYFSGVSLLLISLWLPITNKSSANSLPPHPPRLRRLHLRQRRDNLLLLHLPNRRHPHPRQSLRSLPSRRPI